MRVVREYEVTVAERVIEDLEGRGYESSALLDAMTRLHDGGDEKALYLYKDTEGQLTWDALEWVPVGSDILYEVHHWRCNEVGYTIES